MRISCMDITVIKRDFEVSKNLLEDEIVKLRNFMLEFAGDESIFKGQSASRMRAYIQEVHGETLYAWSLILIQAQAAIKKYLQAFASSVDESEYAIMQTEYLESCKSDIGPIAKDYITVQEDLVAFAAKYAQFLSVGAPSDANLQQGFESCEKKLDKTKTLVEDFDTAMKSCFDETRKILDAIEAACQTDMQINTETKDLDYPENFLKNASWYQVFCIGLDYSAFSAQELKDCFEVLSLNHLKNVNLQSLSEEQRKTYFNVFYARISPSEFARQNIAQMPFYQRQAYVQELNQRLEKNSLSPEERAKLVAQIKKLPADTVVLVNPTAMFDEERTLYYRGLYALYVLAGTTAHSQGLIAQKLAQISQKDAFRLVFDPKNPGRYGGDQGYGRNNKGDEEYKTFLWSLLGKHFDMGALSQDEKNDMIAELAKDLDNSGCGYIAITNAIFVKYAQDPAGFKQQFGFNMCDENGQLNFPYLFAHVYFVNINPNFNPALPYSKEENRPVAGGGGNLDGRREILEKIGVDGLNSAGVQQPVNSDDIKKQLNAGNVVAITVSPVVMYKADGTPTYEWDKVSPGGHIVIVTDVAENGDLTVSSWGAQYTIKASEFEKYGQEHIYKKSGETLGDFTGTIAYEVYG